MSHAIDLTDANFAETIALSGIPALVDFWAPWCGPCRVLGPVVDRVAEQYAGRLLVARVNVDTSPVLSHAYDVRSIPTLILLKDGEPVARTVGVLRFADLTALLDDNLGATKTAA